MTRVAITGSSGFLGAALADRLRADGVEVLTIDRTGAADVRGDVLAATGWAHRLTGCEVVVHAAALVGMPADARGFWRVNVGGTRAVLAAARRVGVARFVLVSSVTVFGNTFPSGVDESHPVRPTGVAYADSKIAAEHLALAAHGRGDIEAVVVRPADVYGPGSRPWTVEPVRLIRTRRALIPGNRGVHSPVYADDAVRGLAAAATAPAAVGRIITLGGGRGIATGDFFDYYARMLGRGSVPRVSRGTALALAAAQSGIARGLRVPVEVSPAAVRYLADRRGTYGIGTAGRVLGWTPAVDVEEGMALTREWLRSRGLL